MGLITIKSGKYTFEELANDGRSSNQYNIGFNEYKDSEQWFDYKLDDNFYVHCVMYSYRQVNLGLWSYNKEKYQRVDSLGRNCAIFIFTEHTNKNFSALLKRLSKYAQQLEIAFPEKWKDIKDTPIYEWKGSKLIREIRE